MLILSCFLRLNQRTAQIAKIMPTTTTKTGTSSESTDNKTAPTHSTVDTSGLAIPPVVAVDTPRTATVLICTAPAVPPPTMIAAAQLANYDISPLLTVIVVRVPATIAAGVAMVSKALSTHGM